MATSNVMAEGSDYQNEKIKFTMGGSTQIQVLNHFKEYLDKQVERFLRSGCVEASTKGTQPEINSKQLQRMNFTGNTLPIFGPGNDKFDSQKMMGIFKVKYSSGREDHILTLSGENQLYQDQIFKRDGLEFIPQGGRLMTFKDMGYELQNKVRPTGKVIDLSTGKETNVDFNKPCAAQKAMRFIADRLESRYTVTSIEMREQMWIAPGTKNESKYSQFRAAVSCNLCKPVLYAAAGGK